MKKNKKIVKDIWYYSPEYKKYSTISLFIAFCAGIITIIPQIYLYKFIREILHVYPNINNSTNLVTYAIIALVSTIGSILVYTLSLLFSHYSSFKGGEQFVRQALNKFRRFPVGQIDYLGSGYINDAMHNLAGKSEGFIAHRMPDLAFMFAILLANFIIMFFIEWRLGLPVIFLILLSFFIVVVVMQGGSKRKNMMDKYFIELDKMSNESIEYIRGITVVKAYQQSLETFDSYKKALEDYEEYVVEYTKASQKYFSLYMFLVNALSLVVFSVSLGLYFRLGMSVSKVISSATFYLLAGVTMNVTAFKIMFAMNDMMVKQQVEKRYETIMEQTEQNLDGTLKFKEYDIEINNLEFSYPNANKNAIDGISLRIKNNSSIAFVGESGSGKSTLAGLIARFFDPKSGNIKIGGIDLKEVDYNYLMENISFVFQDSKLFDNLSIKDNLLIAKNDANDSEIYNALETAQCMDIINDLEKGIDTIIGDKGTFLSKGQRQRLTVARAVLKNSPIIILDEATASADQENEDKIMEALNNLKSGNVIITIAHKLSNIVNCDNIFVFKEGKIIESGTHEQLIKKDGNYNNLWQKFSDSISWTIKKEDK